MCIITTFCSKSRAFQYYEGMFPEQCTKNEVFLRIWSHLLKKSLMENLICSAVEVILIISG